MLIFTTLDVHAISEFLKKAISQIENQKPHQKFPLYGKEKVLQLYLQHPLMECGSDQSSPSQQPSHNKLEYMYKYKF